MSYQVLARKYRPGSFSQLVGQEHVARALTHALEQGRLHHAYLFTGTRGVGKTTIARILARCLNCEQGVSASPCGVCSSCCDIREGKYVDLLEIDAASRTRVEDTRELLDNVPYAPVRGRYKVYLIDEVHMLSAHSFNALLKTLEEPPEHVKFLLATTDPQKLPVTVLSRCLQFALKPMSGKNIVAHLEWVLHQEALAFDAASLQILAHAAQGSMRDALSLTDQALAFGSGQLNAEDVAALLGTVDRTLVRQLLEKIAADAGAEALHLISQMASQSLDFAKVLEEVLYVLHQLSLLQVLPERAAESPELALLARSITPELLQLYYQIAVQGRRDLPLAYDLRSGFEMTVLRMLAFRPVAPLVGEGGGKPPVHRTVAEKTDKNPGDANHSPVLPQAVERIDTAEVPKGREPQEVRPLNNEVGPGLDARTWFGIINEMALDGVLKTVAMQSLPVSTGNSVWELHSRAAISVLELAQEGLRQRLATYTGAPGLQLRLLQRTLVQETPQQWQETEQEQLRQQRLLELREHPQVAPWIKAFDVASVQLRTIPIAGQPSQKQQMH